MRFEEILQNFQYDDLQWLIPVFAGLLIIVLGLLIGLIRGMSAGVLVALFFGGLMCMSPVLLNALQRSNDGVGLASADVARSAAALSALNNDVVVDLSRVVTTMRTALDGLSPLVSNGGGATLEPAVIQRFSQSLSDTEDRLDAAVNSLSRSALLRQRMDSDVQALELELRRVQRPASN
ncbi:MAG: hypothetical protein AAGF45_09455 [Pseudomonadota bacterium]